MSKNKIPPLYYIYRHIRHDRNEVFYIGRGQVYLRGNNHDGSIISCYWRAYQKNSRNPFWRAIAKKTTYDVEILIESTDFDFICRKEIELISLYGRKDLGLGTLSNLSDGGDGPINMSKSSILKQKQTAIKRGTYEKLKKDRQHDFYIYDIEGRFVEYAKNNQDCADYMGCYKTTVNLYCRKKLSVNGYFISRKYYPNGINLKDYVMPKRKRYNIIKYDKWFNIICEYDCIADAVRKDDTSESSIIRGLRTGGYSGGAYWRRGEKVSVTKIKKLWS